MATTTPRLAAVPKLTEKFGITNELARRMFDNLGSTHMAIIELKVSERTEHEGDDQAVKLELMSLEPADGKAADHLRELQRALWRNREPQTNIDSLVDVEPSEDDILRRGQGLLEELTADQADTMAVHSDD